MKKKVLAVLLGGCMVVGMLAGCGSKADDTKKADGDTKTGGSGDSKGYHFEVVVKSFQSSYWQAAVQGINQACDELGVTANTTGPNAESDIADQVNMLNNAINKDPDGIALAACDQNSVIDSLKSALEKKIPVVCFDSGVPDAPEGSVYATVVTDNEQAGGIAAEHIYPAIKDRLGKGQVRVGEVNQDATSANISERGMGFINKFGCDQDKSCNDLLPVSCQSDEWKTSLQKTDNEYTKQCSCDASYTTCHGYTTDDCSTDSFKLESSTTSWLNCSEDSGVCDRSKSCEESTDYICCNMIESYINSGKSCCFFVTSDCKCITSNSCMIQYKCHNNNQKNYP